MCRVRAASGASLAGVVSRAEVGASGEGAARRRRAMSTAASHPPSSFLAPVDRRPRAVRSVRSFGRLRPA